MPYHIANSSIELAHALIAEEKYEEAEQIIARGKAIAESIEARGLLIELVSAQAELMLAQCQWAEAHHLAKTNLPEAQSLKNDIQEAIFWRIIAESTYALNKTGISTEAINEAQRVITSSTNDLEKAKIASIAYRIHTKNGNLREAQKTYTFAQDTFTKLGASRFLEQLEASPK